MLYVDRVKQSIIHNGLIASGERIGAAVSGGADSVYLLHALLALKDELQISIFALHLDHGIRGRAAEKDMAFVKKICQKLSIPLMAEQVDTKAMALQYGWSLEQAARTLRYDFFERTAKEFALDKIALAHHMGDQAETLLLNLVRGCGMQGLLGMQPFRPPLYIRPMLGLEKRQITEALKADKTAYRTDRTNRDTAFSRNRIRHRVLPELNRINPKTEQNILRTVEALATEDDYLSAAAVTETAVRVRKSNGEITLSLENWQGVHTAIKRRVVRRVLETHFSLLDVEFIHIDSIIGISCAGNGKQTRVPGGVIAAKSYGYLSFFCPQDEVHSPLTLVRDKDTAFKYAGFWFCIDWRDEASYRKDVECLDAAFLSGACLRIPQPEDYIVPLGMRGKKKLSDYLSDRKVPLHQRQGLPVLAVGSDVMMVTGVGISETAKVTEGTHRVCRIQYRKI